MNNPFLNGSWFKKTFSAFHFAFVILFSLSLFIYLLTPNLQISQIMSGISRKHTCLTNFKRMKNLTRHFVHKEPFNEWRTSLTFTLLVCAHAQSAIKAYLWEFIREQSRLLYWFKNLDLWDTRDLIKLLINKTKQKSEEKSKQCIFVAV